DINKNEQHQINRWGRILIKSKIVIVTGGYSGMVKAMVQRFAKEGATVVMTGRNEERLAEAKAEIEKTATGIVHPFVMDVRNIEDIDRMVSETVEKFGQIDYLVNNAAGNFIALAEDLSPNGWNSVIDIVLYGTFYCSQAVGKHWIKTEHKGS